jgi:hypothetical protein
VVRDVTAVCPAPVVTIDRSYATPPPACLTKLGKFRFAEGGTWIDLTEQSVRELVARGRCLNETMDWERSEQIARGVGLEVAL